MVTAGTSCAAYCDEIITGDQSFMAARCLGACSARDCACISGPAGLDVRLCFAALEAPMLCACDLASKDERPKLPTAYAGAATVTADNVLVATAQAPKYRDRAGPPPPTTVPSTEPQVLLSGSHPVLYYPQFLTGEENGALLALARNPELQWSSGTVGSDSHHRHSSRTRDVLSTGLPLPRTLLFQGVELRIRGQVEAWAPGSGPAKTLPYQCEPLVVGWYEGTNPTGFQPLTQGNKSGGFTPESETCDCSSDVPCRHTTDGAIATGMDDGARQHRADGKGEHQLATGELADTNGANQSTGNYPTTNHYIAHFDGRLATLIVYLSTVEVGDGGHTIFQNLVLNNTAFGALSPVRGDSVGSLRDLCGSGTNHLHIRPVQGSALLFYSLSSNDHVDHRLGRRRGTNHLSEHAACPVLRGDKWLLTQWVGPTTGDFIEAGPARRAEVKASLAWTARNGSNGNLG